MEIAVKWVLWLLVAVSKIEVRWRYEFIGYERNDQDRGWVRYGVESIKQLLQFLLVIGVAGCRILLANMSLFSETAEK